MLWSNMDILVIFWTCEALQTKPVGVGALDSFWWVLVVKLWLHKFFFPEVAGAASLSVPPR